jgi:urease accessory protein UreF
VAQAGIGISAATPLLIKGTSRREKRRKNLSTGTFFLEAAKAMRETTVEEDVLNQAKPTRS